MMANAYYKLVADYARRTNKDKQDKKPVKSN